jgi:phosphoglycerate kinase
MNKMTVRDVDVRGRRVLVRVDFNVPIADGKVTDDTRIRATLPTLQYLLDQGAALIVMSHLGRPKKPDPAFSLRPVAERLSELLGRPVQMAPDCVGPEVEAMAAALQPGQVLLLENLRFHPEEEKNDPEFARRLARLGDLCVNDAFGAAHRAHASVEAIARFIPVVAGFLMEKEIRYLSQALTNPGRPFVAILGGAKISDKIGVIESLLARADRVLIGGGMANTFLKAMGYRVGDSLVEDEALETARRLLQEGGERLMLPVDVVIADAFAPDARAQVVPVDQVPDGWRILDIGPQTVARYAEEIRRAAFIVWNGPMGVFEFPRFAEGTFAIARAVAESGAISIVGGGDSVAACARRRRRGPHHPHLHRRRGQPGVPGGPHPPRDRRPRRSPVLLVRPRGSGI